MRSIPVVDAASETAFAQIAIALAQQIEKDDRRGRLLRKQLYSRRGGMETKLERVKIECAISRNDNLAVEHAASRQLGQQRSHQLREIAIQRFFVAALNQDVVAVTKNQGAKPIPFRLKNPLPGRGQRIHPLCEHRQQWRLDR